MYKLCIFFCGGRCATEGYQLPFLEKRRILDIYFLKMYAEAVKESILWFLRPRWSLEIGAAASYQEEAAGGGCGSVEG